MVIAENLLQPHKFITDVECVIDITFPFLVNVAIDFSEGPFPLLLYFTLTVWLIICNLYNIMHMSYKNERAMNDEISSFKENENGYMIDITKMSLLNTHK